MTKTLWIAGGALVVAIAAGAAYAARGQMMHHMLSERIEDALDYIDATPQQRAVVEQSKDTILNAVQSRMHRGDHAKIVDLLTADNLDTNALYALADQRAQDIRDLAKVVVPEIQKIHDTLTPAQRQKLADRIKRHHARMMQGE